MERTCAKCGAPTLTGVASAQGLVGGAVAPAAQPRLVFVVPGTATSANPAKAFAQGMADERPDHAYLIRGSRCTRCGYVELYATDRTTA